MPNLPEEHGAKPTSSLLFPFADCPPVVVLMPCLMMISQTLSVEASASNSEGAAERGGGAAAGGGRGCIPYQ